MNKIRTILIKSFIKPFYRQHTGLFFFLFIILFGVVGYANGAGLFAYHFSLIEGILKNYYILLLLLFIWILYIMKTIQFVLSVLGKPEYRFLQMLSQLEVSRLYSMMVWTALMILLPILFYALLIIAEGIYLHAWIPCFVVSLFFLVACLLSGWLYLHSLQNPGKPIKTISRIISFNQNRKPYWTLLFSYIAKEKKLLFLGIKLYSCCILYAMLLNLTGFDDEIAMILLFFSFGILGHGLLIHQLRDFEETRLRFYRAIPFGLFRRFSQYAILYFILLLPEMITIGLLTPNHLHFSEAVLLIGFSYCLILFLNSLLFIRSLTMKAYLKIIFCLFLFIFLSILTDSIAWLCLLLIISSVTIFLRGYYRYEGKIYIGTAR